MKSVIDARYGVVLQPALTALSGVAAAVVHHDGDDRRHALLVNEIVEDRRQIAAVVCADMPSCATMNGAGVPATCAGT